MGTEATAVPLVELADVSVHFGGLHALQGVSFGVSSGEIVGLIGPNGAGKTTAFNVICGFVRPSAGSVRFSGRGRLRPSQLARSGVSRTLQGVGLFPHLTVLENVVAGGQLRRYGGFFTSLLGLPWGTRSERALVGEAAALLERFELGGLARRFPPEIPYGAQKKVAMARALMCRPRLLLLDEPASGLAESERASFAELITELRGETGILLVEHDMTFVMPLVDRLVVLDFGQVVATGTPAEVQSNQVVIDAYLGVAQ